MLSFCAIHFSVSRLCKNVILIFVPTRWHFKNVGKNFSGSFSNLLAVIILWILCLEHDYSDMRNKMINPTSTARLNETSKKEEMQGTIQTQKRALISKMFFSCPPLLSNFRKNMKHLSKSGNQQKQTIIIP